MKSTAEVEHHCNRIPLIQAYLQMRDHAKALEAEVARLNRWIEDNPESQSELVKDLAEERDAASAKLSERKTVHQWLNDKGTPHEENGKPLCLLRRLAIALNVHGDSHQAANVECPHCGHLGGSQPYGMNREIYECLKCKGTWFDKTSPSDPIAIESECKMSPDSPHS